MDQTLEQLTQDARTAFLAGVHAADPARAVQTALQENPLPHPSTGRVFVISVGKAAIAMLKTVMERLDDYRLGAAIAVTNDENAHVKIKGVEVYAAGHPVPDERGLRAARRVQHILTSANHDDLVLCLISGGASALLPAPLDGISLSDKIAINKTLLGAGFDITQMNLVRQSLSALKGGGLLKLAHPARVQTFVLSDVLGDDLRVVGSGPSIGPIGSRSAARDLLMQKGLFDQFAPNVQDVLQHPDDPRPNGAGVLVGSNQQSLLAMAQVAQAIPSNIALIGDVADAAKRVVHDAQHYGPGCRLAYGGETTVQLRGNGQGGRNQELALRIMQQAMVHNLSGQWVVLAGGTDGRDGPTDAAGGILTSNSAAELRNAGIDLDQILRSNDSYRALGAIDAHLMTGATGTNVADLTLFLRAP